VGGAGVGRTAQPASALAVRLMNSQRLQSAAKVDDMWLILLEAALALAVLVFIVWWTMFDKPRRRRNR
jgi:ABC-type uncharacterized transport system permease subunit